MEGLLIKYSRSDLEMGFLVSELSLQQQMEVEKLETSWGEGVFWWG